MNVVYSQNISDDKSVSQIWKVCKIPKNLPQSDLVLPMFKNFKIHYFKKIHTGLHLSVLQV